MSSDPEESEAESQDELPVSSTNTKGGKGVKVKVTRRKSATKRQLQFKEEYNRAQARNEVTNDRWVCYKDGCAQVFNHETNLGNHLTVVHRAEDIPCGYSGCTKTFSKDNYRRRHNRLEHFTDDEKKKKVKVPNTDDEKKKKVKVPNTDDEKKKVKVPSTDDEKKKKVKVPNTDDEKIPRRKKEYLGNLTFHDFLAKYINKRDLRNPESFDDIVGNVDDYKFKNVKERSKSRKKKRDDQQEQHIMETDNSSQLDQNPIDNQQPECDNSTARNDVQDETILENVVPQKRPCLVHVTQPENEEVRHVEIEVSTLPGIQMETEETATVKSSTQQKDNEDGSVTKMTETVEYSTAELSENDKIQAELTYPSNLSSEVPFSTSNLIEDEKRTETITHDIGNAMDSKFAASPEDVSEPDIVLNVSESEKAEFILTEAKVPDSCTSEPENLKENQVPSTIIPSSSKHGNIPLNFSPCSSPPPFKKAKLQDCNFKDILDTLEKIAKGESQEIGQDEAIFIAKQLKQIEAMDAEMIKTSLFIDETEEKETKLKETIQRLEIENNAMKSKSGLAVQISHSKSKPKCTSCSDMKRKNDELAQNLKTALLEAERWRRKYKDLEKIKYIKGRKGC